MALPFFEQPFPSIELDNGYILREQSLEDTEAFFDYYTHPEVGKYILASKPPSLLEASREIQYCRGLFYGKRGIYWTIATKDNNTMIGSVGFYINNLHHRGEITYDLSHAYWRQGIMSQVIQAVVKCAFNHIGLVRVEAVTRIENIPSMEILKKCGFQHEGTLKNYRYFDDRAWDIEMFGLANPHNTTQQ